ncbi:tRNA methyltransferase [Helicobacter mehlei]|uniref:tRNA methyltransferase n=1 Tax=Helicobacter mehlei TaxID=2316080 RepID=UPI001F17F818
MDTIPCLYLDPKDKLQALRSKNALCLALQEHFIQRTPFSKAFRALYHYMDQPNRKIISGLDMDGGWKFMRVAGQIPGYIKGVIPLAQTAIQQIPLYQEFKPKNKAETQFLAHLEQREMLRALDTIDKHQSKNDDSYHPKSTMAAQQFLDTATLIYAPLFNAKKAGLDPIAYLKELQHILVDEKKCDPTLPKPDDDDDKKTCMARAHATLSAGGYNISDNQSLEKLHRALKNLDDAYKFFKPDISSRGLWERLTLAHLLGDDKENNKDVPPAYYADDNIYGDFLHHYQQRIDSNRLSTLYLARLLVLSHNALFYDRLQNDNPKILKDTLKDHPTMCLSPKYLSPKSEQTCLQLFKTQSYNAKDIQDQLHLVRLISIDDDPCVYLDSKNKLQVFKSSNALCLALQKHLEKGLK